MGGLDMPKNKTSLFPSHIVIHPNIDPFTNKAMFHPFVVWKRQGFNSEKKRNVYAFRITTKNKENEYWKIPLKPSKKNGLDKDSWVCVDGIFLLDIKSCEVVGQLTSDEFLNVIKARNKFTAEELDEAYHTLANMINYEKNNLK
jgi:hypothetical protein